MGLAGTTDPLTPSVLWGSKKKENPKTMAQQYLGLAVTGAKLNLKTRVVPLA